MILGSNESKRGHIGEYLDEIFGNNDHLYEMSHDEFTWI